MIPGCGLRKSAHSRLRVAVIEVVGYRAIADLAWNYLSGAAQDLTLESAAPPLCRAVQERTPKVSHLLKRAHMECPAVSLSHQRSGDPHCRRTA
jgi:hypothetical protein